MGENKVLSTLKAYKLHVEITDSLLFRPFSSRVTIAPVDLGWIWAHLEEYFFIFFFIFVLG
jgi:hypothetical protein